VKDQRIYSVPLESAKVEFLEQMVKAYGLPNIDKAVRCLVNYARDNPDKHAAIFADERCLDC
jgi:hypothetical protein